MPAIWTSFCPKFVRSRSELRGRGRRSLSRRAHQHDAAFEQIGADDVGKGQGAGRQHQGAVSNARMGPPVKRSFYLTYCSGILLCSSRGAPGGPGWTRGQLELHDQAHAFGDALALGEIDGVVALDVGAIAGVGRLDPAGRGDLGPSGDRTNLREPRRRPLCGRDRPPQSREALAIVGAVARRHVRLEPQRRRGANVSMRSGRTAMGARLRRRSAGHARSGAAEIPLRLSRGQGPTVRAEDEVELLHHHVKLLHRRPCRPAASWRRRAGVASPLRP